MKLDQISDYQYVGWLIEKAISTRTELKSLLELTGDEWNEEIFDKISERIEVLVKKKQELYKLFK